MSCSHPWVKNGHAQTGNETLEEKWYCDWAQNTAVREREGQRSAGITLCNQVRLPTSTWITPLKGNSGNLTLQSYLQGECRKDASDLFVLAPNLQLLAGIVEALLTPCSSSACYKRGSALVRTVGTGGFLLLAAPAPQGARSPQRCQSSSVTQPVTLRLSRQSLAATLKNVWFPQ